jgi:phosphoribosylformylglycinamidine synthase
VKFKGSVFVSPRKDILDPQGVAVKNALTSLGFGDVADVKVGKYLTVKMEAADRDAASKALREMCDKLLANPITEEYRLEIEPDADA